jgi:hypothetical protein
MKIETQVCTYAQSVKLYELGINEVGYFVYGQAKRLLVESWAVDGTEDLFYPAYTVAELSQMLPDYYPSWRFPNPYKPDKPVWIATVICKPKPPGIDDVHTASEFDRFADTQAEALATLLISLLETGTIKKDDVNARLTMDS